MTSRISRRQFAQASIASSAAIASPQIIASEISSLKSVQPEVDGDLAWYDVQQWGVEGRAWNDTERYFCRLPKGAKGSVRQPIWNLAQHSAGMAVRFETDATEIWADYSLLVGDVPALLARIATMTSASVNGLDLYANVQENQTRWLGVAIPKQGPNVKTRLATGIDPGKRVYTLYLPLQNGIDSLRIGVPKTSQFIPLLPRKEQPIVIYGTSITHGCCASRPGMAYPSILGRQLDRPIVNFGFAGQGFMEEAIASLMGEIEAAVYIVDCLPNMTPAMISGNMKPFLKKLRSLRSETPIVLVEGRDWGNATLIAEHRRRHAANRAVFRQIYERLQKNGMKHLVYVEGNQLLGTDGEATVDGSHPTDLGMMRITNALTPIVKPLLIV